MCGRYFSRREKQQIAERFHAGKVFADPCAPNYNVAPSTFQPVIRKERDSDDREMVLCRWGLVPFFAKSLAEWKGFTTINARAETVTTNPTYRSPFKTRRCIVPVDGFYEWKTTREAADTTAALFMGHEAAIEAAPALSKKVKAPKVTKQPFAFSLQNGDVMAFAGLWDAWHDKAADSWLQSFTIVTTEANELMSSVHTRMPVILHERDWGRWLDREITEQPPIDLLRPFDSELMQMSTCNPAVGNVRNNGPEMLICPEGSPAFNSA